MREKIFHMLEGELMIDPSIGEYYPPTSENRFKGIRVNLYSSSEDFPNTPLISVNSLGNIVALRDYLTGVIDTVRSDEDGTFAR